jgi:surface antigen
MRRGLRRPAALLLSGLLVLLLAPTAASAAPVAGVRAASVHASAHLTGARRDDYPYRGARQGTSDRWGFTTRQCVSFVAWRLAQRGAALDNRTQGWGNASHWDDTARSRGYRVTTRPVAGAVAQWNAWERSPYYSAGSSRPNGLMVAGSAGHVAFVRRVFADGSVEVEHYNSRGDRRYAVTRVRAPRYLRLS